MLKNISTNKHTKRLVHGIGINDLKNAARIIIDDKDCMSPFYQTWANMLKRCYSDSYLKSRPTYKDCTVCDEWLLFSNFKAWMETQDWKGKQIDKDILEPGNRMYAPDFCIFVTHEINNILNNLPKNRVTKITMESKYAYIIKMANEQTNLKLKRGLLVHAELYLESKKDRLS